MGWGGSGGEAKSAQRMTREAQHRTITTLGCHCGSQSWFSGCLLQWLMSYFIFSLDYQERMEHGRRASQPLNLFLFLDSSSSSPHLSDMLKNPFFQPNSIKHDFSSRVIETKWRHVSSAQSLWSVQEHTHYYISTWNSRLFFFNSKGAEIRKSRHLLLSVSLFFLVLPLSVSLALQCKGRDEASDRERWGIQYKAHRGMRESERWKTKRARGEETTGWES